MAELNRTAVESWIRNIATGEFHYTKVLDGKVKREAYDKLRRIIHDICHSEDPACESCGRNDGRYRPIQDGARPLNWQDIEERMDSKLILPFDLRKYVFIYPDTATVVAGSKSSGKTGFLYRTVVLNMNRKDTHVVLLSNLEGGIGNLRDRFFAMDIEIPTPPPFDLIPVTDNYHDYIKERNTIYVVDYIDVPDDGESFYLIGGLVGKVVRKLQGLNSVAVIGLQKPFNRDLAFGKEQTLKKTDLYLAMDSNKLKIVDAKVPTNPIIHPKNMQWTFQYHDKGTRFENIIADFKEPEQLPF